MDKEKIINWFVGIMNVILMTIFLISMIDNMINHANFIIPSIIFMITLIIAIINISEATSN